MRQFVAMQFKRFKSSACNVYKFSFILCILIIPHQKCQWKKNIKWITFLLKNHKWDAVRPIFIHLFNLAHCPHSTYIYLQYLYLQKRIRKEFSFYSILCAICIDDVPFSFRFLSFVLRIFMNGRRRFQKCFLWWDSIVNRIIIINN